MPGYATAHELMYERDWIIQCLLRRCNEITRRRAEGRPETGRMTRQLLRAQAVDFRTIVRLTAEIEHGLELERSFNSWWRTLTIVRNPNVL